MPTTRSVGSTITQAVPFVPTVTAPSQLVTQRATDAPAPGAVGTWRVELGEGVSFTAITSDVRSVSITRGSSQTDGLRRIAETGSCQVELNNHLATYDPTTNPLVRTGVTIAIYVSDGTAWVPRFTGRTTGIDVAYSDAGLFSTVTLTGVDAVASMAQRTLAEVSPGVGAGDTASARIGRLLNLGGIGPSRDIVEGGVTLSATTLGGSVWDEIGSVVAAEVGDCWVAPDGRVAFRPFAASLSGPVAAVFSDAGLFVSELVTEDNNQLVTEDNNQLTVDTDGTPFTNVGVVYDDDDLANLIIYSLPSGTVNELRNDTSIVTYSDGVPITLQETDLPHSTQTLADDWARLTLRVLSTPEFRVEQLEVVPSASNATAQTVLDIDIGDRVTVTFTPPGASSPVTRSCWVRGITDTVSNGQKLWRTTYRLASAARYQFITYDDVQLSLLDSNVFGPVSTATFTGGRYVAVAGDLVNLADWNNLADQMVMVFSTLSAASAAITSPKVGMQVQTTSPFERRYWNGTTWMKA